MHDKFINTNFLDVHGNIFNYIHELDIIVHGCNCFCTMGAGIAKQIKKLYPDAYLADCKTKKGDRSKLGSLTYATYDDIIIVNAYTQYTFWDYTDMLSYDAIEKCLYSIKTNYSGLRIGMPKIGCGLAHGEWNIVSGLIHKVLFNENIKIFYI